MPKSLLLADDSITIQRVVGITFANEDFTITTVDNGEDAILKARQIKPQIVLADVIMPKRNGYEVCQAIKSDPELRQIPVLLLAGTFEAFDENRAREAGADGHITKPFESQALIDKVNELLAGGAARPAAAAPQPVAAPRPVQPAPVQPRPIAPIPQPLPPVQPKPIAPIPQAQPLPPVQPKPIAPIPQAQPLPPVQPRPIAPIPQAQPLPPVQPRPIAPIPQAQPLPPVQPRPIAPIPQAQPLPPVQPRPITPVQPLPPVQPTARPPMPDLFGADSLEPPASEPIELEPMEPEPLEPPMAEPEPVPAPVEAGFDTATWGEAPAAEPASMDIPMEETPMELSAPEPITSTVSEPPPADLEPAPPEESPAGGWGEPAPQPGAWDSTPPSEPDAALPIDLEPDAEPLDARPASLAELAQETVTEPPPVEDDMPSVDIDADGAAEERPRLAPMHEFIPDAGAVGEQPAEETAPPTRRAIIDPAKLEAQAVEAVREKAGEIVERLAAEIVERVAREVLGKAAQEALEKVAWEVVPALAETILREEIEKLVAEKLREG